LVAGGTWFGVTRTGRWALITNFREGQARDPSAPSRGSLVARALADDSSPLACAAAIATEGDRYHGFNLLIGEGEETAYVSNRASGGLRLGGGLFGLSNHLLDTPWPKVVQTKALLLSWLRSEPPETNTLFEALGDRARAPDDALPATGVSREWERAL